MTDSIIVLPSSRTKFLFKRVFNCYEILDIVKEASENNIKIKFSDVREDISIIIERLHNTEYNKTDSLIISVNNAEFIGGQFLISNNYNGIAECKIIVGETERDLCSFFGERADAIFELTKKRICIKEIVYIDNSKDDSYNYSLASEFRCLVECVIDSYINNRF